MRAGTTENFLAQCARESVSGQFKLSLVSFQIQRSLIPIQLKLSWMILWVSTLANPIYLGQKAYDANNTFTVRRRRTRAPSWQLPRRHVAIAWGWRRSWRQRTQGKTPRRCRCLALDHHHTSRRQRHVAPTATMKCVTLATTITPLATIAVPPTTNTASSTARLRPHRTRGENAWKRWNPLPM